MPRRPVPPTTDPGGGEPVSPSGYPLDPHSASREPGAESAWAERNAANEAAARQSEAVTADEAEWLARRIGRDGALTANEKALLRFIRDESPAVHPSLQTLIAKAA